MSVSIGRFFVLCYFLACEVWVVLYTAIVMTCSVSTEVSCLAWRIVVEIAYLVIPIIEVACAARPSIAVANISIVIGSTNLSAIRSVLSCRYAVCVSISVSVISWGCCLAVT